MDVDSYIKKFPLKTQKILIKVRSTIKDAAPGAVETISYSMPAFKLNGRVVVYFAGYKKHIGLYPMPEAIVYFKKELINYKTSKGAIQFSLDKPIPYQLIQKIVKWRMNK